MSIAQILEAIATVVLSSYFVILSFTFFKFRLVRKKEELDALTTSIDLEGSSFDLQQRFDREFSRRDYLLPVIFVTVLSFIGLFLLLMGWTLYETAPGELVKSMLWSGSDFWVDPVYGKEKKSLAVVGWALLGGYMSGAQYIYRRFATIDLTPGNFYSIGIRMVLAPIISLMISYLIVAEDPEAFSSNVILIIAFLTGLFPERGLKMLLNKASKIFPKEEGQEAKNIPLEAVEGISYFHRLRLNEVGIDNVQNLANYDFLALVIKTPFPVRVLLDWVSQAKLMMEFRENTAMLHKAGIRSALDFLDALEEKPERINEVAALTGLEMLMLEINLKNLQQDKSVWLLRKFMASIGKVHITD